MTSRPAFLARVREARGEPRDLPPVPRGYRRRGALDAAGRVALFEERAADYRARVVRTGDVAAVVASTGVKRLVVPAGAPSEWVPRGVRPVPDRGLTPGELDAVDGVLTGCTLAIAETGTIVLTAGPAEGRRALTLVPDLHVCVVAAEQIVELVPEAFERLAGVARPITLVSGPSATSDIELDRVEGVHGPRTLVIVITG